MNMKAAIGFFVIFALCHLSLANENGNKCKAEAVVLFGAFNTILQSKQISPSISIDITCIETHDDTSVQQVVLCTHPLIESYLQLMKEIRECDDAIKKQIIEAVDRYIKNLEAAKIETVEIPMITVLPKFKEL